MKRDGTIVLVSRQLDPHVDLVLVHLESRGEQPVRVNSEEIPLAFEISLSLAEQEWTGRLTATESARTIRPNQIRSVWWRRPGPFGLPPTLGEQERTFARLEIQQALRGMWESLDCYWISRPSALDRARWKPEQLSRAAAFGFDVPRTIVTNVPDEARAFWNACGGDVIYKTLSDASLGRSRHERLAALPRITYTTAVTTEMLATLDNVRAAPCLFQERIPKHCELRVTVIGDQPFAAQIDSQADADSQVDWRNGPANAWSIARVSPSLLEKCVAFVRSYGLEFSALDLIHTPDDRYVFVENNPNGQFLFLDEYVPELHLKDAICDRLIAGAR